MTNEPAVEPTSLEPASPDAAAAGLQRAADENLRVSFGLLVPHATSPAAGSKTFGEVVAVVSGSRSPFFNPVIVAGEAARADDVRAAVEWGRGRGVEPCVAVRSDLDPAVAEAAPGLGLVADTWALPGLVLEPVPEPIPAGPRELQLAVVEDATNLEAWYAAAGNGMRTVIPASFAFDPAVWMVVGSVEGTPVCTSIVVRSEHAHGIYAVGTVEDARRRGYGAAVTWAAIEAGRRAWGDRPVILQSSEMGDRVYRAMGFREICRYVLYVPRAKS
jgi:GNAT superfamily N-acetyltransferase